jgi:hypothetical protein
VGREDRDIVTTDDLNLAVRNLVRFVMGMPDGSVRPANQVAPSGAQTQEIATVLIVDIDDEGWAASTTEIDENDPSQRNEALEVPQVFTASIQFFRAPDADAVGVAKQSTAAFDRARRLPVLLQSQVNTRAMAEMGLGFESATPARNLTAVSNGTWESRGSVDVRFTVIDQELFPIQTITTVPLTTEMQDPGGTITTTNTTVEVSP